MLQVLADEYRKAAQRSLDRGDFRRAAYIHGFLLHDDRSAASALEQGGLHHDAALLYLKIDDAAAAARAFEAAGEIDRAIAIHRQLGRNETAGDLLRRIGEEERAVAEYNQAALNFVAALPPDFFAAGRLMADKARQPDRAMELYRRGWALRPRANAVLCALEMARTHAQSGEIGPIRTILHEAEAHFATPGTGFDGFFYHELVGLGALPAMAVYSEELRDHALQSLVKRLGVAAADWGSPPAPALVSELLGRGRLWPAGVVSDAEFAAKRAIDRARDLSHGHGTDSSLCVSGVQIGRGTVTAVCRAAETGEVLLGFDSGQVYVYWPANKKVVCLAAQLGPVVGLAVDVDGRTVAALHDSKGTGEIVLTRYRKGPDGSYRSLGDRTVSTTPYCWLTPVLSSGIDLFVGCGSDGDLLIVDLTAGVIRQRWEIGDRDEPLLSTAILLPRDGESSKVADGELMIFTHEGASWKIIDVNGRRLPLGQHHFEPAAPRSRSLLSTPIFTRFSPPLLELIGIDQNGAAHAVTFHVEDGDLVLLSAHVAATPGGYLAAARMGMGHLLAVSATAIDRFDCSGNRVRLAHHLELGFPTAVACFALAATDEILIVCSDGLISRVATARRARGAAK